MNADRRVRLLMTFLAATLSACASGESRVNTGVDSAEEGMASYYAAKFNGRTTASGEVYDETELTAAHPKLPFGTRVRVTNLANGKSLELRINDRGPFVDGRIIDVSHRAAEELGFLREGLARVRVQVLPPSDSSD